MKSPEKKTVLSSTAHWFVVGNFGNFQMNVSMSMLHYDSFVSKFIVPGN